MNILDITEGSKIEIESIHLNNHKIYSSMVISVSETRLEISPIIEGKSEVIFGYDTIINIYYYPLDRSPILFKNCRIHQIRISGVKKWLLSCETEGEEYTERLCQRININKWGILHSSSEDIEVLIHDISYNGFAVIAETKIQDLIGSEVTVSLIEGLSSVSFTGRVVRNMLMDDGKVFMGCYVSEKLDNKTVSYIRKKLKVTSQSGTRADRNQ